MTPASEDKNPPKAIHFCWIGSKLDWVHAFAMLSALRHGELDQVVLHHTDLLDDSPVVRALQTAGVFFSHLDVNSLLNDVGAELGLGAQLTELYARLSSPAILSDILRAAILYRQGGIYLDVDTLTIASLRPLLRDQQFIGLENIVWPYWVKTARSPLPWARAVGLDLIRKTLRRMPNGWRLFRSVQGLYFKAVNGAIMGGAPQAPLFATYLQSMINLPSALQSRANMLGPDLLQVLIQQQGIQNLRIYPPDTFYPLPPEISEHWFRPCTNAPALLKKAIQSQTLIVHWYASVRSKPYVKQINPDFILKNQNTQLYSALICKLLPDLNKL